MGTNNIINKVITIENENGNTLMSFQINEQGNIIQMRNCDIADIDIDTVFNSNKEMLRIQILEKI